MDESYFENNSLIKKLRCFNRQVENTSNTSGAELISIDEINNTDTKSSLLTRKHGIKEYLTTLVSEKNTASTKLFQDIHNGELINFVSTIDDYKKPVKVKSRWMLTSQMEEALENSSFLQTEITSTKNNSSCEIINEVSTKAVGPVNILDMFNDNMSMTINNHNYDFTNTCSVVVEKCDALPLKKLANQVKKKRGRPKKKVIPNQEKVPVALNIDSEDLIGSDLLNKLKPEDSDKPTTPLVVKRGRGRPKKIGIASSTIPTKPQIVFKRGRKNRNFTNVKKRSNIMESNSLKNGTTSDISNDLGLSTLEVSKMMKKKENKPYVRGLRCKIILDRCDNLIKDQQQKKILKKKNKKKSKKVETIDCLKDRKQDLLIKFDKANWNIVPKHTKTMSLDGHFCHQIRHRRNSLSDNFVYDITDFSKVENDDVKLKKSWKSLSYLQGGPNIQIEQYKQNELRKKFRTELKRSRSFPNCMLLDTVIWRFLVNEQSYYNDDNFILSDSEINLLNELSEDGYNHQHRSKSTPVKQCEYNDENNKRLSRSLENLSCTENLPPFQINADECDLKNTDECETKIRRSKRLTTKIKHADMIDDKCLQESDNSKHKYLLLAEQIRNENERQLSEAMKNDQVLEKKLKKLNFTLITNNLFRPDKKKMSSEYTPAEAQELRKLKPRRIINADTYTCHCKYSTKDWIDGKPGCGPECINRLLNIECGSGCSLKSFCTNKQFQNKQFKRTEIVRTPNKGYGVFALEDIPSGTFVDEYMGEVIDQHQMIIRMKTKLYKNNNYMVQLKHDEIIDATRKGNITRFINHSCEPNCVAEKWNVLGESRMGFFTKVPILKGEEITFDYSFEIFGDAAQQECYCNALKCRGFISKKSRTGDQSSSDESDDHENDILTSKTDEREKKKKIIIKKITNKDKKRLRELDQQLTDISKLKNKNRSDLESSTLNLNKLMVHITDSMSRSHILKFIRENDLNCKRLFMNFNGLSIIHSWMISSNHENLKLEIIQTLSELPISNRNTITKSKVLDIVAEWAKIPFNIKKDIEKLDYPVSESEEHVQKIDTLLPNDKLSSLLAQSARDLWKKWIILKMVFIIPKLERPKDVSIPNVIQPSIISLPPKPKPDQCYSGKPIITTSQNSKSLQTQKIPEHGLTNPMDRFSKMVHHQIQINKQEKSKAVSEWDKNNLDYSLNKVNKNNNSSDVNNTNHVSTSAFTSDDEILEIPTIESNSLSKKSKWSTPAGLTPAVLEVLTDSSPKHDSTYNIPEIEPIDDYSPIEVITTSNKTWNPPPPTIDELQDESTLESILKTIPPCLSNNYVSNQYSNLYNSSLTLMNDENVMYDAQHPSIEEQLRFWSIEPILNKSTKTVIDILETSSKEAVSNTNSIIKQPVKAKDNEKILFEQCQINLKRLIDNGFLDTSKSAKENFIDRSPIKITDSFFQKKSLKNKFILPNFFKRLKIISNFYREQPSKLVKIMNYNSKCNTLKSKNDTFRIKEDNKTEKTDATSVALKFHNEQLSTAPQNLNVGKLLKNQTIEINTENKFALKIFNALKKNLTMPQRFIVKHPPDTKVITLDPKKELELHHKLVPTVKNTLCAKLKKENNKDTINVFKQEIIMKYDETKIIPKPLLTLEEVFRENLTPENIARCNAKKPIKRKIPLNTSHKINVIKCRKTVNSPNSKSNNPVLVTKETNNDLTFINPVTVTKETDNDLTFINPVTVTKKTDNDITFKNPVTVTKETNDDFIFKKPMIPKRKSAHINTTVNSKKREHVTSKPIIQKMAVLKRNANEMRQEPSTSSQVISSKTLLQVNENDVTQGPCTLNKITQNSALLKTNAYEMRQKPLMKCLPFNSVNRISTTELEQNAKNLATCLSMNNSSIEEPISQPSNELIDPIVDNFKASVTLKKTMNRTNLVDDPIVRDYLQRTQLKTLESKRKCKLPESMMSLPVEVLNLVPDNQREIKYVIDFYHSMATVIVKVLDSYVKKSCKQGRIKNDEDFKFIAKKLNSNILFKELQVKKVEELKISDSVKQKVEQYIKKYMLKYGKVYRRKSTEQ